MGVAVAHLELEQLADRVWTASDGRRRVAFAAAPGGVVAVNTLGSAAAAGALREAVERVVPGARIVAVICSIDHLDVAGHAAALGPGVEVVAHELCARVLAAREDAGQLPADRVVHGDGGNLEVAGLDVHWSYPGPTQGTGNIAVRLAGTGVCCMVGPQGDARLGLLPDIHVEHVVANLRTVLRLGDPVWVPGRGPVLDAAGVERFCALVEGLQWVAQKAFAEGIAVWDLRAMTDYATEFLRGEFGMLDGFADHVGPAALRIVHHYLMGGWGLEDTQRPQTLLGAAPGRTA